MSTTALIAIVITMYVLTIAEHVYQHRTHRHDLLRDALEAALRVRIEHRVGPHIFMIGFYFGESTGDVWVCLPFFMVRIVFKKR